MYNRMAICVYFMNVVTMSFHNISKDLRLQTRRKPRVTLTSDKKGTSRYHLYCYGNL